MVKCNFIKDHRYYILDQITEDTKHLTYFERLTSLEDRLEFKYTCRNLTELLNSSCKWGVDNSGKIFDLSIKERFPVAVRRINRTKPGLIWVNRISYPLELDPTLNLNDVDRDVLKAVVIYIDNTWTLYKVTYENTTIESMLL